MSASARQGKSRLCFPHSWIFDRRADLRYNRRRLNRRIELDPSSDAAEAPRALCATRPLGFPLTSTREIMRPSQRKYLAVLVTFFLLASFSANAFNAIGFVHKLDHERHAVRVVSNHSHFIDSHEPSEELGRAHI